MKKTNRQILNERLDSCSDEMRQELEHYLELESVNDYSDAFIDVIDFVEGTSKRSKLWGEIKSILVEVRAVEPVDINKVFSTGAKYWFIFDGQHYDFGGGGFEGWLSTKQPLSS